MHDVISVSSYAPVVPPGQYFPPFEPRDQHAPVSLAINPWLSTCPGHFPGHSDLAALGETIQARQRPPRPGQASRGLRPRAPSAKGATFSSHPLVRTPLSGLGPGDLHRILLRPRTRPETSFSNRVDPRPATPPRAAPASRFTWSVALPAGLLCVPPFARGNGAVGNPRRIQHKPARPLIAVFSPSGHCLALPRRWSFIPYYRFSSAATNPPVPEPGHNPNRGRDAAIRTPLPA
jgi:hypothetical protein